jgi:phosphatidate cytidylyltransferase
MIKRVLTAIVLILIAVPTIYFGGIAFTVVSTIFGLLAGYEITRLLNQGWPKWARILIIAFFGVSAVLANYFDRYNLVLQGCFLIFLLLLLIWNDQVHFDEIGIVNIVYFFMITVISTLVRMHQTNVWLNFMIMFATYFTDTFCLFGGMAFGKHKLNERISPKKTIEGSFCGWLAGAIITTAFGLLVIKDVNKAFIIACGLLLPIVGQMGDLAFSAIKRYFKIKDFGTIFPGHGGVLDRIDSLLFNVTAAYILASVIL